MTQILLLGATVGIILWACTPSEQSDTATREETPPTPTPECWVYQTTPEAITVRWTAFKTTEKVAVGGTFDSIEFHLPQTESSSLAELFKGARATIYTTSVNSGDTGRDRRIAQFFFGIMQIPDRIEGQVQSWDEGAQKATIAITMNGITQPVAFTYQYQNDTLTATATLDLPQWKAEESVQSLNKACYDLHKGPDGISKLWEEVDVQIQAAVVRKPCS